MTAISPALVVSVSGIRDDRLLDAARFTAALEYRGISPSLLVAPHLGADWSLRDSPAVLDWVRRRRDEGAETGSGSQATTSSSSMSTTSTCSTG